MHCQFTTISKRFSNIFPTLGLAKPLYNQTVMLSKRFLFAGELQKLIDFNPDACFVCLGGNDIRPGSDPSDLVKKILIVTDKMKESGVKKIYVSEISNRGNFKRVPGLDKNVIDVEEPGWVGAVIFFYFYLKWTILLSSVIVF